MKAKNLIHPTKLYFDQDMWVWLQTTSKNRRCSVSYLIREMVLVGMKSSGVILPDFGAPTSEPTESE